ncbi:MAG TPA: toll/interleukin-1 receptor domain-containing protein [Pirellulaceae bacterium]|jgi:hypothetical protein
MADTYWPWRVELNRLECEFVFFVSHVMEDNDEVLWFANALEDRFRFLGIPIKACFLDVQDWEHGNPPKDLIRRKLAASHFFLGWISPNYLKAAKRGWVWFELAYAELIELSRQPSVDIKFPFILPVLRNVSVRQIGRTPWLAYVQREIERSRRGEKIEDFVERLVSKLVAYYSQEINKWEKSR